MIRNLISYFRYKDLPKNTSLSNHFTDSVLFVDHGSVIGYIDSPINSIDKFVLAEYRDYDFINLALFLGADVDKRVQYKTRTKARVYGITFDRLKSILSHDLKNDETQIIMLFAAAMANEFSKINHKLINNMALNPYERVKLFLRELTQYRDEAMTHPDGYQIHTSRQRIAENIWVSREQVGKDVSRLHDDGVIQVTDQCHDIVVFGR